MILADAATTTRKTGFKSLLQLPVDLVGETLTSPHERTMRLNIALHIKPKKIKKKVPIPVYPMKITKSTLAKQVVTVAVGTDQKLSNPYCGCVFIALELVPAMIEIIEENRLFLVATDRIEVNFVTYLAYFSSSSLRVPQRLACCMEPKPKPTRTNKVRSFDRCVSS